LLGLRARSEAWEESAQAHGMAHGEGAAESGAGKDGGMFLEALGSFMKRSHVALRGGIY